MSRTRRRASASAEPEPRMRATVTAHPLLDLQRSAGNRAATHVARQRRRRRTRVDRPSSSAMLSAYQPYDYRLDGPDYLLVAEPGIRKVFEDYDFVNTCAARLTNALIDAGHGITSGGWKDSQGRRWMPSARKTRAKLTEMWGPPDQIVESPEELAALRSTLAPGQVAVFGGQGHVGIVTDSYQDQYADGYVPYSVWILSASVTPDPGGGAPAP